MLHGLGKRLTACAGSDQNLELSCTSITKTVRGREQALYHLRFAQPVLSAIMWAIGITRGRAGPVATKRYGRTAICACSPTRIDLVIRFQHVGRGDGGTTISTAATIPYGGRHRTKCVFVAAKLLEERDAATGLTVARDPDYWIFFEWARGEGHGATPER